jgi:curved DNA-binding protein CbpA
MGSRTPATDRASLLARFGLPTSGATRGDLVRAFRRLASALHPDHGGSSRAFTELLAARELLEAQLPPGPPALAARSPVTPVRQRRNVPAPATLRIVEGPLREARGAAGQSTTSYPQEIADFTPWDGADWTGASSGLAWVPNPREYADPRRHGPTYRARGVRRTRSEPERR